MKRQILLSLLAFALSLGIVGCAAALEPQKTADVGGVSWLLGAWEGEQGTRWDDAAKVRITFTLKNSAVLWQREILTGFYAGLKASGETKISGNSLKLTGSYDPGEKYDGFVQLWLERTGDGTLTGTVRGSSRMDNKITLRKAR